MNLSYPYICQIAPPTGSIIPLNNISTRSTSNNRQRAASRPITAHTPSVDNSKKD